MIILGHHCFANLLVKKLSHNRCALFLSVLILGYLSKGIQKQLQQFQLFMLRTSLLLRDCKCLFYLNFVILLNLTCRTKLNGNRSPQTPTAFSHLRCVKRSLAFSFKLNLVLKTVAFFSGIYSVRLKLMLSNWKQWVQNGQISSNGSFQKTKDSLKFS